MWLQAPWLETPTPVPSIAPGLNPNDVSPGLLGFLATFALVAMVIPLVISLNRHLRRVKFDEASKLDPQGSSGEELGKQNDQGQREEAN